MLTDLLWSFALNCSDNSGMRDNLSQRNRVKTLRVRELTWIMIGTYWSDTCCTSWSSQALGDPLCSMRNHSELRYSLRGHKTSDSSTHLDHSCIVSPSLLMTIGNQCLGLSETDDSLLRPTTSLCSHKLSVVASIPHDSLRLVVEHLVLDSPMPKIEVGLWG